MREIDPSPGWCGARDDFKSISIPNRSCRHLPNYRRRRRRLSAHQSAAGAHKGDLKLPPCNRSSKRTTSGRFPLPPRRHATKSPLRRRSQPAPLPVLHLTIWPPHARVCRPYDAQRRGQDSFELAGDRGTRDAFRGSLARSSAKMLGIGKRRGFPWAPARRVRPRNGRRRWNASGERGGKGGRAKVEPEERLRILKGARRC